MWLKVKGLWLFRNLPQIPTCCGPNRVVCHRGSPYIPQPEERPTQHVEETFICRINLVHFHPWYHACCYSGLIWCRYNHFKRTIVSLLIAPATRYACKAPWNWKSESESEKKGSTEGGVEERGKEEIKEIEREDIRKEEEIRKERWEVKENEKEES